MKNRILRILDSFAELMRYKLSVVVTFSAATGYFLFRSTIDHYFFFMVSGVFLLASGASVLNQYEEREQDSMMVRTRNRPIPAGKISLVSVLLLFLFLLISGCCLLLGTGIVPCILGMACIVLYNFIYTPMKKISALAIFSGALVGAIPPLIGFIAAGGTLSNTKILWFSVFMFLWQLPHFWILLMRYGKEYQSAGFKTLLSYMNEDWIKWLTFFCVLFSLGFLTCFFVTGSDTSNYPALLITILNFTFLAIFSRIFLLKRNPGHLRRAFILLNSYALVIMIVLIANSIFSRI